MHPTVCCSFSVAQPSAMAQCCIRQFRFNASASSCTTSFNLATTFQQLLTALCCQGNFHPLGRPHIISDFYSAPFTWTRKRSWYQRIASAIASLVSRRLCEEAVVINYQEKKEKISKILSCWLLRRLTLLGKVAIIKSLAASQLVYIMSSLPSSQSYLKEIHQLLYNFLWDRRGDKVKRSV